MNTDLVIDLRAEGPSVPVLPALQDRWCSGRALDNPLRRWLSPASQEVDRLGVANGAAVADLGTGVGFFVPELLRRLGDRGRLWAIDPDPANLRRALGRVRGDARVVARVGTAAHVPELPDGSIDRVLLSLVLCCLVEKEAVMDEVWRLLRPGGRTLVTYPDRRVRLRRNVRSLRVTPERWEALRSRRAWEDIPVDSGWIVRRHLLQKPPV